MFLEIDSTFHIKKAVPVNSYQHCQFMYKLIQNYILVKHKHYMYLTAQYS